LGAGNQLSTTTYILNNGAVALRGQRQPIVYYAGDFYMALAETTKEVA